MCFYCVGFHALVFFFLEGSWGMRLESSSLFSCAYDNILGFNIEWCRRLGVIYSCARKRFQFYSGEFGFVAQGPVIK